jgi:hypothetical protein
MARPRKQQGNSTILPNGVGCFTFARLPLGRSIVGMMEIAKDRRSAPCSHTRAIRHKRIEKPRRVISLSFRVGMHSRTPFFLPSGRTAVHPDECR